MNPALLALILTQAQANCLNASYNEGVKYGLGRTFESIVLVESSGCVNEIGDDGRSVGPAQIQVYTARKICGDACGVSITADNLRNSQSLNLALGAKFLALCFANFWPDKRRSLYCYSAGIPRAAQASYREIASSKYVNKVELAIKQLDRIRISHD